MPRPVVSALVSALVCVLALAGCSAGGGASRGDGESTPTSTAGEAEETGATDVPVPDAVDADDPALDVALSEPQEDSVYPDIGDPGVDLLHVGLGLVFSPDDGGVEADETVVLRATEDADRFQLDLAEQLDVGTITVDGEPVEHTHDGKDLVVETPVTADERYTLRLTYSGVPEPYPAPSERPDFDGVGWHTTEAGTAWTMHEPYGAFTFMAVNDQPADKALYDVVLTAPEPLTGVANGEMTGEDEVDLDGEPGRTTTWHLDEPASSYLTTVAFDEYDLTELTSGSGVPVSLLVPADDPSLVSGPSSAPDAIDWLEDLLGPYPFDTAGIVIVDSDSALETQTMITMGDTTYSTSPPVVVHEFAHQWYGDTVSPNDWSEVWMNEGMATYLQGMWESERAGRSMDATVRQWVRYERHDRADAGPFGGYRADDFGSENIYYGPAVMWHEVRQQVGDDAFFAMVRAWPQSQENDTADREEYLPWVQQFLTDEVGARADGVEDLMTEWLTSPTTPQT